MSPPFTPPHYGFETKETSSKHRVFRHSNGAKITVQILDGQTHWYFFSRQGNIIKGFAGRLTEENGKRIIQELKLTEA